MAFGHPDQIKVCHVPARGVALPGDDNPVAGAAALRHGHKGTNIEVFMGLRLTVQAAWAV